MLRHYQQELRKPQTLPQIRIDDVEATSCLNVTAIICPSNLSLIIICRLGARVWSNITTHAASIATHVATSSALSAGSRRILKLSPPSGRLRDQNGLAIIAPQTYTHANLYLCNSYMNR
jgi:hypothetical protein